MRERRAVPSAFDRRVWAVLARIPRGRVMTYAGVARAVGAPRAARAVAQSCGRNPRPVVVPCHRVIRSDGAIGGYSGPGGRIRKRSLLRSEGVAVRGWYIMGNVWTLPFVINKF
ncbi:MGMT family protein [Candidatus Uhrbacteria bacterium]|nr:MGMT family protein [Candidatus Uhrbacteria bacterium]